jgi:drug/metabolite transporter (DMT)-like permease
MIYFVAFLCVLGMVAGQILFKLSADAIHRAGGNFFDQRGLIILLAAVAIYGITTLAWVWILQKIELGRVYPLMALAFILVPLASYFILGERFQMQYFIGVALIIAGIVVVVKA